MLGWQAIFNILFLESMMELPLWPTIIQPLWKCLSARLLAFCFVDELVATNDSTWLADNYKGKPGKIMFENKEALEKEKATVLQNSVHPSQQKFFEFLSTENCMHITLYPISLFHSPAG